jgi:hypothetical protein
MIGRKLLLGVVAAQAVALGYVSYKYLELRHEAIELVHSVEDFIGSLNPRCLQPTPLPPQNQTSITLPGAGARLDGRTGVDRTHA